MKMCGGSESTKIIGPFKSVLVYALHSLEYALDAQLLICYDDYCALNVEATDSINFDSLLARITFQHKMANLAEEKC